MRTMSLDLNKDVKILMFCRDKAHTRYEITRYCEGHYAAIFKHVEKLFKMGLLTVVGREEKVPGKIIKHYLITEAGLAMLKGVKEAYRKE